MSHQEDTVLSLISGFQFRDSRVYEALAIMARDLYALDRQINPPTTRSVLESGIQLGTTSSVTGFTVTIYGNNIRLTWASLEGSSSYEIKYKSGTAVAADWTTANSILRTSSLSADINPLTIPITIGTHSFLIKSTSNSGVESENPAIVTFTINQIVAPVVTATIIDNNVLLNWTAPPSQFDIAYYNVYKNAVLSGTMNGTFEAIFETISGTYTYAVEAVDIVGNVGLQGNIIATVNQPPDYELQDERTSSLTGTKTNVIKELDYLLCCVNLTETYENHFINNAWTTPQAQVTAGYPIYIQPALLTGVYEEIIDYGVLPTNNIVTIRWSEVQVSGAVAVVSKIASSEDNISYTAFTTGTSAFYSSLRYVKLRFEFTAANATELLKFSTLQILLNVKREVDSGQVTALAADGLTGTEVLFNKTFKDIDSIELTVAARQPVTAIYRFTDIPNPTGFHVLAYDSSGNQVDYLISWMARGVV